MCIRDSTWEAQGLTYPYTHPTVLERHARGSTYPYTHTTVLERHARGSTYPYTHPTVLEKHARGSTYPYTHPTVLEKHARGSTYPYTHPTVLEGQNSPTRQNKFTKTTQISVFITLPRTMQVLSPTPTQGESFVTKVCHGI